MIEIKSWTSLTNETHKHRNDMAQTHGNLGPCLRQAQNDMAQTHGNLGPCLGQAQNMASFITTMITLPTPLDT